MLEESSSVTKPTLEHAMDTSDVPVTEVQHVLEDSEVSMQRELAHNERSLETSVQKILEHEIEESELVHENSLHVVEDSGKGNINIITGEGKCSEGIKHTESHLTKTALQCVADTSEVSVCTEIHVVEDSENSTQTAIAHVEKTSEVVVKKILRDVMEKCVLLIKEPLKSTEDSSCQSIIMYGAVDLEGIKFGKAKSAIEHEKDTPGISVYTDLEYVVEDSKIPKQTEIGQVEEIAAVSKTIPEDVIQKCQVRTETALDTVLHDVAENSKVYIGRSLQSLVQSDVLMDTPHDDAMGNSQALREITPPPYNSMASPTVEALEEETEIEIWPTTVISANDETGQQFYEEEPNHQKPEQPTYGGFTGENNAFRDKEQNKPLPNFDEGEPKYPLVESEPKTGGNLSEQECGEKVEEKKDNTERSIRQLMCALHILNERTGIHHTGRVGRRGSYWTTRTQLSTLLAQLKPEDVCTLSFQTFSKDKEEREL